MTEEGQEFRSKEFTLQQYLLFRRSREFMHKFCEFYDGVLEYQRTSVKEERLRRMLASSSAASGLKVWRKRYMKKSTYEVIEKKLWRLKQRQRKR